MAGTNYPDFYEAITNTSTLTLDTLILNSKVITAIENIPMGNANNDILIWDFTNQQWIPSATYFGRGHLIDGTEIAPALAFNSNTNTGIYKVGNNIIGFSCNGVQQMRLTTTEAVFNQNIEVNNILSTLARGIVIGQKTPDRNNVYIGWNAGNNIASTQAGNVFIGERAGSHSTTPNSQSQHNIAIGYGAGMDNNGTTGNIAIGYGTVSRGSSTIIIGNSGHSNTTNNSIMLNASGAITYSPTNGSFVVRPIRNVTQTGGILQYNTSNFEVTYHRDVDVNQITMNQIVFTGNALRIGQNAVTTSNSISIGIWAGGATTTSNNINIGFYAGFFTGTGTQLGGGNISIGYQAGNLNNLNVNNSVSLGNQSRGNANNAVCIGNSARSDNVNCIVLNASGITTTTPQSDSLIIRPIRNTNSNSILQYNPTTFEVTHSSTLPSFTTTNATINGVLTIPSLTGNRIVLTDASDNLISSSFTDTDFARVGASNTFTQNNTFSSNVTINGTTTISNLNPNKIVLTDASDNLISSSFTDTDFARVGASNTFTQSNTFSNVTINGTTTISNLNPNKIVLTDASDNLISSSFTDTDFARVGASNTFTQNNIFSSPITLLLGTVGNPSINFSGDTNTGIYSSGADIVNIVTGGTSRMQITNTGTTINNLTTTGVTSSGNISIISPSGHSEILIQTQNNLTSKLSLKEFSTSYGMELIYNGTDNAFYIDALNVTRTTIFSTSVVTNISTFFRPVYFENNIFFPNTSTISIAGLSQPTNTVINPQFTFLNAITKVNQKTGLSYNDVAGASPSLVLVADSSAILQAGVNTGVTAFTQIRGTKSATVPTYSFRDDTNTGITSDAADSLKIMCGGVTNAIFDTGDISLIANDITLQTSYLSFGTSGQLFLTYNTVPGSGYDALNFYCQSKLRFQIVDNTSNIQECRFMGVTAQGASYLSIIYWSDAHVYYRNSRNANDPTPKRHYFQAYDYQGLKSSYITPGTTSWQTFTGQHIAAFENMVQINVGYIVVSTGKISSFIDNKDGHLETKTGKDGVMIDEALPIVTYSSKMNQKSVFGVVCSVEAEDAETRDMGFDVMTSYSKDKNDRRVIINSIGEGAIWVCNSNGNLENGDYITSSIIRGLGCKQHDDLLHNYTVAKITIDCNFDDSNAYEIKYIDINDIEMTKEEYEIKKQTEIVYIKAFLPCTYHCG